MKEINFKLKIDWLVAIKKGDPCSYIRSLHRKSFQQKECRRSIPVSGRPQRKDEGLTTSCLQEERQTHTCILASGTTMLIEIDVRPLKQKNWGGQILCQAMKCFCFVSSRVKNISILIKTEDKATRSKELIFKRGFQTYFQLIFEPCSFRFLRKRN